MSTVITSLLQENFKDIIYIGGAIASFFVGSKLRRINIEKEAVVVQATELENVEAALKIYRLMLTDLQDNLKKAEAAYLSIEEKLHKSLEVRKALFDENQKLKIEINELRSNSNKI